MSHRREQFEALDAAEAIAPAIRDAQGVIEADSVLPPELAAKIAGAGMFRLLLSKEFGGFELSLPDFIRVVEVIGGADGSAGWCTSQGSVFGIMADHMDPETAAEIWGANKDAAVATGAPIRTEATHGTDNDFLVSGYWRFVSGCGHANWIAANCNVVGKNGDQEEGRFFIMPRAEVTTEDAWNVRGMRGTGSHAYTLDNQKVISRRSVTRSQWNDSPGKSTGLATALLFACGFGSVGLGLARRALDSFVDLAEGKVPMFNAKKLREDGLVQTEFAETEALYGATRAFLLDVAEECAEVHAAGDPITLRQRARLRLAATHAMRKSADIVDHIYELSGTDAIFDNHPIQRCFQDIHALTQQIQGRKSHYRTVGGILLGLEGETPFV